MNLYNLIKKQEYPNKGSYYIKIYNRNLRITKDFIGLYLAVYNGHLFIPLKITKFMLGRLIGSFVFSYNILIKKKSKNKKWDI